MKDAIVREVSDVSQVVTSERIYFKICVQNLPESTENHFQGQVCERRKHVQGHVP
jgi:hypothetical protein